MPRHVPWRPDFFKTLPAEQVDAIEALIDDAAEDGYQTGYEAGYEEGQYDLGWGDDCDD